MVLLLYVGKLSDVKKRFDNREQTLKNPINGRRINRLDGAGGGTTTTATATVGGGGGDSGSVGSGSVNSVMSSTGGSVVRQKYGAGKRCFAMMMTVMMMME